MAEALSVSVGLISLGIQVTESLAKFYHVYKHQDSDVARTIDKLEGLSSTFRSLEDALSKRRFQPEECDQLQRIETSIQNCDDIVRELQNEYKKLHESSTGNLQASLGTSWRRGIYPLRKSTLQKLDEDVVEMSAHLSFALSVLQLQDQKKTQDDIEDVKSLLKSIRTIQISAEIQDWLKAPDATINHNIACAKRHPGTGLWLVKGELFRNWLSQANSFLWLKGFAGCGKSVLCSTAIQYAFRQRRDQSRVGIGFFYFAFDDEAKRDESALIRALLFQLAGQTSEGQTTLSLLHKSYRHGTPPAMVLTEHLRHLLLNFDEVYILVDALDESPRYQLRDDVLATIQTIRSWALRGLHLLVTSRDEIDIRESLCPESDQEVIMKSTEIDQDIANFVSGRLQSDLRFRKWQKHHKRIQEVLAKRAQGVFRWVECQFDTLSRCPRSEHHLNECLQSLPRNLDATYERMLCNIDKESAKEARRMLVLLCFSIRPMTVPELIDGMAVQLDEPAGLAYQKRLEDADSLREICPGLIDIVVHEADEDDDDESDWTAGQEIVRIAHFSVQEYLESARIREQQASFFALSNSSAHSEITRICCVYLLEPELRQKDIPEQSQKDMYDQKTLDYRQRTERFPLARFAAEFWYQNYRKAIDTNPDVENLVLSIFQRHEALSTWIHLCDVDEQPPEPRYLSKPIATPVYYASLLGLDRVLESFFASQKGNNQIRNLVNAEGGAYNNALQAATAGGHIKVVQMLLDAGAEIDAQDNGFGGALRLASACGHEMVVQMLLRAGAEIKQCEGFYSPLEAATKTGSVKLVQVLLDAGAKATSSALAEASGKMSRHGREEVVQTLLDAGASVTTKALLEASERGNDKVVKILANAGGDVNAQDDHLGAPLHVASTNGKDKVVRVLLDAGAEVNAQHQRYHDRPLHCALTEGFESAEDYEKVVQILLGAGADFDAHHGKCLSMAVEKGNEKIVQMLLDAGADVNAQGGPLGIASNPTPAESRRDAIHQSPDTEAGKRASTALQRAASHGHKRIVEMLLNAGADVNARDGEHGHALQAASLGGHKDVVQMLMDAGAEVNAQSEVCRTEPYAGYWKILQTTLNRGHFPYLSAREYGNALQAASYRSDGTIVQRLLNAGANINVQGGLYGNALQAASVKGEEDVVLMLIKAGADVNAHGGEVSSAIQAASIGANEKVVQLLINAGANVNSNHGPYGSALQMASRQGDEQIVSMLICAGAYINAQGGSYGSALQAASLRGYEKVVRMLLDAGADVNAQERVPDNAPQATPLAYRLTRRAFGTQSDVNGQDSGFDKSSHALQLMELQHKDRRAPGREVSNALQAASIRGEEKVVQMLLDAGADVNAQGGLYGNALQAASLKGNKKVVQMLVDAGADLNSQVEDMTAHDKPHSSEATGS